MANTENEILSKLEEIEGMLAHVCQQSPPTIRNSGPIAIGAEATELEAPTEVGPGNKGIQQYRHAWRPAFPDRRRIEGELRYRKELCELFGADLVADPVWTMILELMLAESLGKKISVTSLCLASGIAQTTALRWIGIMESHGILEREPDRIDRRRIFVTLTYQAQKKVAELLQHNRRTSAA